MKGQSSIVFIILFNQSQASLCLLTLRFVVEAWNEKYEVTKL